MAVVTLNFPGMPAHQAQDLVRMALNEWRSARFSVLGTPDSYVQTRYAHMEPGFRVRKLQRLRSDYAYMEQMQLDTVDDPMPMPDGAAQWSIDGKTLYAYELPNTRKYESVLAALDARAHVRMDNYARMLSPTSPLNFLEEGRSPAFQYVEMWT